MIDNDAQIIILKIFIKSVKKSCQDANIPINFNKRNINNVQTP